MEGRCGGDGYNNGGENYGSNGYGKWSSREYIKRVIFYDRDYRSCGGARGDHQYN